VQSVELQPTFWRNISPTSSGSTQQTARRHIPEDDTLHKIRLILKVYTRMLFFIFVGVPLLPILAHVCQCVCVLFPVGCLLVLLYCWFCWCAGAWGYCLYSRVCSYFSRVDLVLWAVWVPHKRMVYLCYELRKQKQK
jgi:hypothetical protein